MNNQLNWVSTNAQKTKDYPECIEYTFKGKIPYAMAMKIIEGNEWQSKTESNSDWYVSGNDMGFHFNIKTKQAHFTRYVGR